MDQRCECCALCSLAMNLGKGGLSENANEINLSSPIIVHSMTSRKVSTLTYFGESISDIGTSAEHKNT